MAALGRWLLPGLVLALILGLVVFGVRARAASASASTAAKNAVDGVEPPSGPSPLEGESPAPDTPFERQLQKRLAAAAGQSDAIEALVDAYVGVPLSGVAPTDEDKWRARERGCWMLENAGAEDPRRALLDCGSSS